MYYVLRYCYKKATLYENYPRVTLISSYLFGLTHEQRDMDSQVKEHACKRRVDSLDARKQPSHNNNLSMYIHRVPLGAAS